MRKLSVFICFLLWSMPALAAEVYFSPSTKCESNIIALIDGSEKRVDVAVYALNNVDITEALKRAERRGVKVRILTDRLQAANKRSKVMELYDAGVNIRVHSKHKIEHNKFAVFDGKTAVTGSYNWTEPATEKNSENCIFIYRDREAVEAFARRFAWLWKVNTKKKSDKWFERKKALSKAD